MVIKSSIYNHFFNQEEKMKKFTVLVLCLSLAGGMAFAGGGGQRAQPASGGPVEFSATFAKGVYHGDPNDMSLYTKLGEETNVKVNWIVVPETNWSERYNIMINSGDLPDVFYRCSISSSDVNRYGRQGLFIELTDLINRYAPNLVKVMNQDPLFKAGSTNPTDGKIYTIKTMTNRTANNLVGTIFIYQPWLDKLGIPFPVTYLDFENMMREFKTKDPNGNGRADEFPFVFANGWSGNSSIQQFFAIFGYGYRGIRPDDNCFVEDFNGKAVFVPGTPNFREAIVWLHKLFAEGLFAEEDYAAMDRNLFTAKCFSEEVVTGSFSAFHKNSAYVPEERYDDYTRLDVPLKGPHGDQIWVQSSKVLGLDTAAIITNKGANKAVDIMRWIDAHFEPVKSMEMIMGPIGINLERRPDGMIGYVPTPPDTNYNQFRYGQCGVSNVPSYIAPEAWGTTLEIMEEDIDRIPWVQNILKPYLTQWFIYSYPVDAETQFIQNQGKEIDDYVKITQSKWLMQGGIEQEWDAFQARLKAMGVDEYIKVMQNQIDRFNQYSR